MLASDAQLPMCVPTSVQLNDGIAPPSLTACEQHVVIVGYAAQRADLSEKDDLSTRVFLPIPHAYRRTL